VATRTSRPTARHAPLVVVAALIAILAVDGCAARTSSAATQADVTAERRALWLNPESPEWRTPAPPVSRIRFETSKGVFVVELVREWGPVGADLVYNLARLGYYDDTRFHRVNRNYIAQFGLHSDPAVNAAWKNQYLGDDRPRSTNVRGTFAFAMKGQPNTRNTQIFINLADNPRSDAEAFTILGTVIEGMAVLDSLYSGYGEGSGSGVRQGRQGPLESGGNAYMDREFPLLDRIRRVTVTPRSSDAEQRSHGTNPPAAMVASFDGLGIGFNGPQGPGRSGNPSDNSLAVGPNHIVQTVNSRMAIFTKKGAMFDTTGRVLYGSVSTNNVFRGFTGTCETRNNGDAVVRYDQLADRWLIVMPIFSRAGARVDQPTAHTPRDGSQVSVPGVAGQPGPAVPLYQPPAPDPAPAAQAAQGGGRGAGGGAADPRGVYSMCYAVSATPDPFGPWHRYEFLRALFPDYPRPAIWPDGYYVPTSTSDDRISESVATQKHACVADRARMLAGEPATEQCVIIENVNFLNNADVDGLLRPPAGAPNIMMAAGGRQLDSLYADSVINVWQFHVDWSNPANTKVTGPDRIPVAPYHYLCNGQLSNCVPQPGTDRHLDSQGDKLMARLVYRRIGDRESIVATHSINTSMGGGGVRWYEFRVGANRSVSLHQQGTYTPDSLYRWMASPAMDGLGNIGIGYSYGGLPHYAGQRFAGRLADDPLGQLTRREAILAEGEASQTNTLRWQDYTQTAIDPSDDCTIWYVGDYLKQGAASYSTRIGAFRMPGCAR